MRTSYAVRDSEIAGRPDYGSTTDNPPAGTLMEDYEYIEGTGDLDTHNGRSVSYTHLTLPTTPYV